MKLLDAIMRKNRDAIYSNAQHLNLNAISKLKKKDLALKLSNYLLNEENLTEALYFLSDDSLKLLKLLLNKNIKISDKNFFLFVNLDLINAAYIEDDYLCVAEDLKEVLIKVMNNNFYRNHKKYGFLIRTIELCNVLYGIYNDEDIIKIFKMNNKPTITINEIYYFINKYYLTDIVGDNYFCPIVYNIGLDVVKYNHNIKNRYVLDEKDINDYYERKYINNIYYQRFEELLYSKIQCRKYSQLMLGEIFDYINNSIKLTEILKIIVDKLKLETEEEFRHVVKLFTDLSNNTRILYNNGNTPKELSSLMTKN